MVKSMRDYALILNAGSSSLKFRVYAPVESEWRLLAGGQIAGIGRAPTILVKDGQGNVLAKGSIDRKIQDGHAAIEALAEWLRKHFGGARLLAVGHRVVHGGALYGEPVLVTEQVLSDLKELIPLAPLHQPYNLAAIEAVFKRMPDVPQVACFDTAFHQTHAPVAKLLPLPKELRTWGLRRYGFHGLSYEYVASALCAVAPEIARGRVIIAHLGNGASLCALKNCLSVDTSLGFTALDGLCMGTRPGSLDPGAVLYLFQRLGLSANDVQTILYKKSGLLGISGISNDMRDLLASSEPDAGLAVDYFVYRAAKEIGAMAAVLGGVDGLVFTAGIGENSAEIRRRICDASSWLGVELDPEANLSKGPKISTAQSKVSTWVIPTDEELMIARHTAAVLGLT